jgi:nucleoside-diphosphate-sugar epimerase
MMKIHPAILVTGGAGFIGSHLVEYFLKIGEPVRILDNFSSGREENLQYLPKKPQLEVIKGDISDFHTVLMAMKGIKYVFHEAGLVSVPLSIQQPSTSFRFNTVGTFNIFEAARLSGVSRVIFASSAAVYGKNNDLPLQERTTCLPLSPYALEKHYAEQLADLYYRIYGLASIGLRYFNVYGPRQSPNSSYSGVISILVDRCLNRKRPFIYGNGEQTRDFIYVKDVVNANIHALEAGEAGAYVFNVGSGKSISIKQLLQLLQQILKTNIKPKYLPPREGDIYHSCADITQISQLLDWQPRWEIAAALKEYLTITSRYTTTLTESNRVYNFNNVVLDGL